MKKKRNVILAIFVMVMFVASTLPVLASSEEYKVIKKAVKNQKSSGEISWFKIEVTEKGAKKAKVKIKVPFSLVEMFSDCEKEGKIDLGGKCKVNLKKVLQELKKHGPTTLIEVESEEESVKIWLE